MKQEFYDLAKKIADWHTVTFKDADKAGQLLKLDEEFDEWRAETADPEKRITELADCFIVASALWFRFEAAIGMFTCKAIVKHCADADGELSMRFRKRLQSISIAVGRNRQTGVIIINDQRRITQKSC